MDNMDKIRIHKMMYNNLKTLAPDIVAYTDNDRVTIINLDGKELDSGTTTDMHIIGGFVIHRFAEYLTVKNYTSDKNLEIGISKFNKNLNLQYTDITEFKPIGDSFLLIEAKYGRSDIMLNRHCEIVGRFPDSAYFKVEQDNPVGTWFVYKLYSDRAYNKAYASKVSNKVEIFGGFDLNSKYNLIATEMEPTDRGISINKDASQRLRYKLAKDGIIIGKQTHSDIIEHPSLRNTDYFMSVDEHKKLPGRSQFGLVDNLGNEILESNYDSIKHIGAYNFILESAGYYCIFNTVRNQVVFNWTDLKSASPHDTLPITIVRTKEDNHYIIDTKGRIFIYNELHKYLECYRCKEDEKVIKVVLDSYIRKYVTATLIPITNMSEIAKLNSYTWERM